VLAFHQGWFWVAVLSTALVGLWGLGLAVARRLPGRPFTLATGIALVAMLTEVASGLVLYARGMRPGDGFHLFYGVVIVVTLAIAYVYRAPMRRRPALSYGLLLLFVMGLGLRAWAELP
jgi:hypothetical protein